MMKKLQLMNSDLAVQTAAFLLSNETVDYSKRRVQPKNGYILIRDFQYYAISKFIINFINKIAFSCKILVIFLEICLRK